MGRPYKCPACSGQNTVSKGKRVTKTMGVRRIRLCRDCGRKFTPLHQTLVPVESAAAATEPRLIDA